MESTQKVLLFQTDNRPDLDYLGLTRRVNEKAVEYLNRRSMDVQDKIEYSYAFQCMENRYYETIHPATAKIHVVKDLLHSLEEGTLVVFLDSDAWIQNPHYLHDLNQYILASGKQGCFSRDPYVSRNDYINSGSFVIKNNEYTRTMYTEIQQSLEEDPSHHRDWTYDQYYIAKEIEKRKDDFLICIPPVINTPEGQIIRHHWYKTHSMYHDLYELLEKPCVKPSEPYYFADKMDQQPYPNPDKEGYDYRR